MYFLLLQIYCCLFCLFCIPSSSALLSAIHSYNNNIHLSCLQFSPRGSSSSSASNKEDNNGINNYNKRKLYDLEVIDLEDLSWYDDRKDPPATAVASMKRVLDDGLTAWSVIRHGVSDDAVKEAMDASRIVFAQSVETKRRNYAVGYMDRSRGWEMYPHHVKFQKRECTPSWDGILCERYVMGPPSVCEETPPTMATFASDPYYASDFGRVFYERNRWPNNDDDGHRLKKAMHAIYHPLYRVSAASMRVLAVALGAPSWDVFDSMIVDPDVPASLCPSNNNSFASSSPLRHHSRLQINHYPKIPDDAYERRRKLPFRANAHLDTSLLTVLARELNDGMSAGALEIQDNERFWRVPSLPGSLTVQFGSLIEYFTHSKNCCHGATHRVTTPKRGEGSSSSRCSIGFVLKPDYTARAQPPYSERIQNDAAPNTNPLQHNDDDVFPVALLGRVGWQNHAMIFEGKTRAESIAAFKPWKNEMRRRRFG